jgi:iron(III) transport system permease protein
VAYVAKFTPYAQRSVAATLLSISTELDECSRVSGASWGRTMREVVLPLLRPGIVGGWLLLFIILFRELGMSLFLYGAGTETVSIAIYLLMLERPTTTAAACLIQTAVILLAVMVLRRVARDDELAL